MRKDILVLLLAFATIPASASQPGHPIDCSDWVFDAPGYSCTMFRNFNAVPFPFFQHGGNAAVENTGAMLTLRLTNLGGGGGGDPYSILYRIEIVRLASDGESVIGRIEARPTGGTIDQVRTVESYCYSWCQGYGDRLNMANIIAFDTVNGRLLIPLESGCHGRDCPPDYGGGRWIASIGGFAPLMEVLQSFTPSTGSISFRVPAIPEGLHAADHFDTYWGHVSDLPDFARAQPMQCDYPETPPVAGTYLTVADTSRTPPPGQANYIVTAVSGGTQRRCGRQRIGGQLSGRDPAMLPDCP